MVPSKILKLYTTNGECFTTVMVSNKSDLNFSFDIVLVGGLVYMIADLKDHMASM